MNIQSLLGILTASVAFASCITYYLSKSLINYTFKVKELELENKYKSIIENLKTTLQLFSYKENKLHVKCR